MTVEELIDELMKCSLDANVFLQHDHKYENYPVDKVLHDKSRNKVVLTN